ncbi:MAG: glycosyltransferase family 2 protein [Verrucomicrobia bacterium]|nr:glycosyltransferase family 2 protein [Verrucomicrobiota bacterium]
MPIYNEQETIATVVGEWIAELRRLKIPFAFLALNDGSRDETSRVLEALKGKYPDVLVAVEKQNSGHGRTCRLGYETALARGASWILQIDSDGQCLPKYFASFWSQRDEADCIFGERETREDGWTRVWISKACGLLSSLLAGISLGDANVPYRLIRAPFLQKALGAIPGDFDMQNIALTLALKRDHSARWRYVPIHFPDRQGGTNSINLKRILGMGWTLLTNLHRIRG